MSDEIQALEEEILKLNQKLAELRKQAVGTEGIPNYTFETLTGPVDLLSLFAGKDTLFAIHNMGQACRYCTLWADGRNSFLPHLEDRFSVVLLSKDAPEVQQRFAHSRGWRMASHGGGKYMDEQSANPGVENMPGLVYQRKGSSILRKNATTFGPGDSFCSIWHVLMLAGIGEEGEDAFIPQYSYWKKPEAKAMEDGGQNLV